MLEESHARLFNFSGGKPTLVGTSLYVQSLSKNSSVLSYIYATLFSVDVHMAEHVHNNVQQIQWNRNTHFLVADEVFNQMKG